ncbi:MAG: hypothetical protein AB7P94_17275 [Steroidobacteraceae bacterium]
MKNISEWTLPELENASQKLFVECGDVGASWAAAKATSESLEELKKVTIARLKETFTGADNKREMDALATNQYSAYLDGLKKSKTEFYKLDSTYKLLLKKIDFMQSVIVNRREELKKNM